MTYASHVPGSRRLGTFSAVLALHLGVGAILVQAFAPDLAERFYPGRVETWDVPLPEKPPASEPATKEESARDDSAVIVPQTVLTLTDPNTGVEVQPPLDGDLQVFVDPLPPRDPPLDPALPAFPPRAASPRNDPASWVGPIDYPGAALHRQQQGTSRFRVVVGSDGTVKSCEITATSGSAVLDNAACKLVSRRARFDPARNDRGETIVGTYANAIQWRLPE